MNISLFSFFIGVLVLYIALSHVLAGLPVFAAGGGQSRQSDSAVLQMGRDLIDIIYRCDAPALWARMAPSSQTAIGGLDKLQKSLNSVMKNSGKETGLIREWGATDALFHRYRRVATYAKSKEPGVLTLVVDLSGRLMGFQLLPKQTEAYSPHLEYVTPNKYRLPFSGDWFVFWGGRSVHENYHAVVKPQRFAYDFVVAREGSTHAGAGSVNEDYYCFGLPIYAPGPGKVVKVVDGVADNTPGVMNGWRAAGNHVIIEHSKGEYSFLCHLKEGSVAVKKGDRVDENTILGLCGNSGNSSEPHLHFHVQDTSILIWGNGIPVPFNNYIVEGRSVESGEPVQGEIVTGAMRSR